VFAHAVLTTAEGLLMTPRRTETDGFFVAVLMRRGEGAAAAAKEPAVTETTVTEW
jgi:hypothetical protein